LGNDDDEIGSTVNGLPVNVVRLVRGSTTTDDNDKLWDPSQGALDPSSINGADAIIHLAGR